MMTTEKQSSCPSEEELSAWYDSQLRNADMEAHVAVCSHCRAVIGSYETIDLGIRHTLKEAAPPDRAKRITQNSMKAIRVQQRRTEHLYGWLRVAVCVAVMIGVIVMALYLNYFSGQSLAHPDAHGHIQPGGAAPLTGPDLSLARLLRSADAADGREQLAAMAAEHPGSIHHVWAVADPAAAVSGLRDAMPAVTQAELDDLVKRRGDQCALLLELKSTELVKLVEQLDRQGGKLITESSLKPGQPLPPATPDLVCYHLEFVRQQP